MKNTGPTLKALVLSCGLLLGGSSTLKAQTNQKLHGALQDSIQAVDSIQTVVSDSTLTVPSDSTSKEKEIGFFDAVQELKKKNDSKNMNKGNPGIEPDPDDDEVPGIQDGEEEIKVQPNEQLNAQSNPETEAVKKDTRIAVHGMLSLGTNGIAGDAAELCSTNPTLIGVLNIRDQKTGLGFTGVRLDDGQNDPEQPASRVTILNPNFSKKFGKDGQFSVSVDGKYAMFDKMSQANGFSPDIVSSWTTKNGFTFEGMYSHKFKKGADSDAFRLSITKQIDNIVKLTAQGWYETSCDSHFYGRVICETKIKDGIWAQVSLIQKNGKWVPTGAIIYTF